MNSIIKKYIPEDKKLTQFDNLYCFKVDQADLVKLCNKLYIEDQLLLKVITAFDEREQSGNFKIMYVFGIPKSNIFIAPFILAKKDFPSITPQIHAASIYERKIKTFFGLNPIGHPNPQSLILHANWPKDVFPLRKDFDWQNRPKKANNPYIFRKIEGEGVYELPVGPVHAGIIEPGHFRFNLAGEEILSLEPYLGYSHKGSEKLYEVLSMPNKIKLSNKISGDSAFSHSLAFCQAIEKLSNTSVNKRDKYLRVIFAELERLAYHFGDIGAIMTDTGYNFGGAQGSRLREVVMQINFKLSIRRFLRNLNTIGGVTKSITREQINDLLDRINKLEQDFSEIFKIASNSSTLYNRLKDTGILDKKIAIDHSAVGVVARACGIEHDARIDYPYAGYNDINLDISIEHDGDVNSRFLVRVSEVHSSFAVLRSAVALVLNQDLDQSSDPKINNNLRPNSYAISIVEGWRGDIVYIVSTDKDGQVNRVDVRDPSFLNWTVVGYAGLGNMVPDFPLINKSFSLSYSGNDV